MSIMMIKTIMAILGSALLFAVSSLEGLKFWIAVSFCIPTLLIAFYLFVSTIIQSRRGNPVNKVEL